VTTRCAAGTNVDVAEQSWTGGPLDTGGEPHQRWLGGTFEARSAGGQDSPCAEANLLPALQPGLGRQCALTGGRRSRTWQRSHERLPALALTTPDALSPYTQDSRQQAAELL